MLLVTAEEVHLYALHADALHPRHLLFARHRSIHAVFRALRSVVLKAVAVVPQQQTHALALCITAKLFDALAAYLLVPQTVNEAIFVAHLCRRIDKLHLVGIVHRVVLPDEPAPRVASRFVLLRRFELLLHHVVGHGCLHNGFQRGANGYRAPRSSARQGEGWLRRTPSVGLALHGKRHLVAPLGVVVGQSASGIAAVGARFAHEHPTVRAHAEQTGEGVARAIFRLGGHRSVGSVLLFIARLGAFPSAHGVRLRTDERRGLLRQSECSGLFGHYHARSFAFLRKDIAERHVAVAHAEHDGHGLVLRVLAVHT